MAFMCAELNLWLSTLQTYVPPLSNELAPYPIITLLYTVKATSGVFLSLISPSGPVHWTAAHKFWIFFFKLYDEIKWQRILYTLLWLYNDDDQMFLYFGFYLFSTWIVAGNLCDSVQRYATDIYGQSWLTWFSFILLSRDNTFFFMLRASFSCYLVKTKYHFRLIMHSFAWRSLKTSRNDPVITRKRLCYLRIARQLLEATGLIKRISTVPYFFTFCPCACLNYTLIILL